CCWWAMPGNRRRSRVRRCSPLRSFGPISAACSMWSGCANAASTPPTRRPADTWPGRACCTSGPECSTGGAAVSEIEHWDERYRTGNTPWQMAKPSSELVRVVTEDGITPCAAIALGCGLGTHSIWLAQRGFAVPGVDISPLAIEGARERAAAVGVRVRFLAADLLAPPDLGGPYGFFFDRGCYHIVRGI